tara:strand:- start:15203 stop:16270 length:1068 start_codon:yes stop_codon:yes gene_type:complete
VKDFDALVDDSIHCYYKGKISDGRFACEELLRRDPCSSIKEQTKRNRTWYTRCLKEEGLAEFADIKTDEGEKNWSLFNPTILKTSTGLIGIVRSSNYKMEDCQYIIPEDDKNIIKTKNIFFRFDENLACFDFEKLEVSEYKTTAFPVDGLEDCRLRTTAKGIGVSATIRNAEPYDGRCRIALANFDLEKKQLTDVRVLGGECCQHHEKNWMPIEFGNNQEGGWIYSLCQDEKLLTVEPDEKDFFYLYGRKNSKTWTADFRGGSQAVRFGNNWVCCVHDVTWLEDTKRVYNHFFVVLDDQFTITKISQPFDFLVRHNIEFCAGLVSFDNCLIASFGSQDKSAHLAKFTKEQFDELF